MLDTKSGDWHFQKATQLFSEKDWANCVSEIEKALSKRIKKYEMAFVYAVLGYSLAKLYRYDEAIQAHKKSLEYDQNHLIAWHYYGITLRNVKQYNEAEKCYERALQINPQHELTLSSLGALYIFRDKPQKAIDILERASSGDAESGITLGNLSLSYAMVGRFDDAEYALAKSVKMGYENWKTLQKRIRTMKEYQQSLHLENIENWLPLHCTSCGAPVTSQNVQWLSKSSVICGYCGTRIKQNP